MTPTFFETLRKAIAWLCGRLVGHLRLIPKLRRSVPDGNDDILAEFLGTLPAELETIFMLRCAEGLSAVAVADRLNLSPEVVDLKFAEALVQLRRALDGRQAKSGEE